jgi:DNA-binding SARP family transcriptional activator
MRSDTPTPNDAARRRGARRLASRQPGSAADVDYLVTGADPVGRAKILVVSAQLGAVESRLVGEDTAAILWVRADPGSRCASCPAELLTRSGAAGSRAEAIGSAAWMSRLYRQGDGVEFRLLGPLEVLRDGAEVPVRGVRQRELLALLLLHAGQVVSSDRLMDALWGESQPAAGVTALRVRVSQLRKALGPAGLRLVTRPPGYALLVEAGELDLQRFERALDRAAAALPDEPAAAVRHADLALSLWRGPPLADIAYSSYAQTAITRLEELRAAALELRVEAQLALGRHAQMIGELQQLVAEHPLRERMWGQLMLALYRADRQADALAAYRAARRRLVDEVGLEPGPGLRALESAILTQDRSLALGARAFQPAPSRAVLALMDTHAPEAFALSLGERLARRNGHELIAIALVGEPDELRKAASRLHELTAAGTDVRVAAFTSADRGADVVRLAAEQDVSALLVDLPEALLRKGDLGPELGTILASAACDVALVAGASPATAPLFGPVLVPFGGHTHDWCAAEIGAWLSGGAPLRLLGVRERRGKDASRILASASLALQRTAGVAPEPVLVDPGEEALLAAAAGASAIVAGLSERWTREGIGAVRLALARRAPCPVLLVRSGLRPGGLAPAHAMTSFTWSGAG